MSDHNPQDVEVKRLPFAEAASGAVGLQTMLPAALRLIHSGEMDFKTLIRAMSTRPAELLGLPGGSLRAGSPGRRRRDRSRYALGARSRRSQIAMQEHAVRRSPLLGARRAHHRGRADGLRTCLTVARRLRWEPHAMTEVFLLVAFLLGYLLGSIPFGMVLTKLAGTQDLRSIGSRQYRRHQRAAHRPQGPRRGDADRRHAQGHGRGHHRRLLRRRQCGDAGRARRLPRPPLPGLAQIQRRQRRRRPISAC